MDNHRRIVSADSALVCTERFRYFENSEQRGRKYPASGKPEMGFAARRRGLSVLNALDILKTPDSEAEK